jgi:hypothetical protein
VFSRSVTAPRHPIGGSYATRLRCRGYGGAVTGRDVSSASSVGLRRYAPTSVTRHGCQRPLPPLNRGAATRSGPEPSQAGWTASWDLSGRFRQQQSASPHRLTTRPASTRQPHSAQRISTAFDSSTLLLWSTVEPWTRCPSPASHAPALSPSQGDAGGWSTAASCRRPTARSDRRGRVDGSPPGATVGFACGPAPITWMA